MSKDSPPFCDEMRMYMEVLKQKILRLNENDSKALWEAYRMVADSMSKIELGYNEAIVAWERLERQFGPVGDVSDKPKPFDLKDAVQLLRNEIQWCHNNPDDDLTEDYQKGFVAGLAQAALLLQSGVKVIQDEP